MHDGLDVVPREESRDAVADALEPAVIVLLDDVDDGSFHEGQLVLLVLGVVVDGDNWRERRRGYDKMTNRTGGLASWTPTFL